MTDQNIGAKERIEMKKRAQREEEEKKQQQQAR
jgi:hypothetical protein